jgi:uncharacterized protein (DUF2267 family)
MEYDLFIQQVRTRARLRSTPAAVAAARATLSTLAERLGSAPLNPLRLCLPDVFDRLQVDQAQPEPKLFSFDSFCQRLADHEQTDVPASVFHARCVIETLRAKAPHEVDALAEALPRDFVPLFRGVDELRPAA